MKPYTKTTTNAISTWAEEDRPREKLMLKGKPALSDAELIAILIGSGNASESAVELSRRVLKSTNHNLDELGKLGVKDLCQFKGIGEAKAISIIAALELGRRRRSAMAQKRQKIESSKDVYELFHGVLEDLPHEEFWVLLLNRANKIIAKRMISRGGISGTVADPKLIYSAALDTKASALILVHNHPSGNLNPSDADKALTRKLKSAGEFLDLPVLDHLIVTGSGFFSFADEGLI